MFPLLTKAQKPGSNDESYLKEAIKKAYPASVRIWGFDTNINERTSAQFSGVVVTADGLILTAAHTTSPGKTYKVFFPDGKVAIAKALGRIDLTATPGVPDAAMMQIIDQGPFPFATLGFSSSLKMNQPCISISYPEKLDQPLPTIRYGKVVEMKNEYGFIQSTCKMEPGDSGGPLFDQLGRVIGIHSAIDVAEEMNFEIPVNVYRKYWTALHAEKNYNSYPDSTTFDGDDTLRLGAASEIVDKHMLKIVSKAQKANQTLLLTSRDGNLDRNAGATLINYRNTVNESIQLIVSKNSIVAEMPNLWVGGTKIPLEIIKRDNQNDLILLKAAKQIKGGMELDAHLGKMVMGTCLISLLPEGKYQKSILGSGSMDLAKITSLPYIGATVLYKSSPAAVSVVKPGSPAALAGMVKGDLIIGINKVGVNQASEFAFEMAKYWAGEEVAFEWLRGNDHHTNTIKLIYRPFVATKHPVDRFTGGSSERRDGFKQVFAHDAIILPVQCGTPIVDGQGRLIGINIARYSRAISLGIPVSVIVDLVDGTSLPR